MKPIQLDTAMNHPSFLALDRAHLGHAGPDLSAHLESCEQCRGYLESLSTLGSASGFVAVQRAIERRPRFSLAWVFGPASLAVAACCLFLFVSHRDGSVEPGLGSYVGAKGFRSVWIYVKHGTETLLWDGKQPLSAGDRVRLKIDPGSYHRVAVYSLSDPQSPSLLFEGALSPGENLTLPEAWEIDGSPKAEQLFVVFSDAPVVPAWDDWRQGKVSSGVAVLPFVLPKAGSPGIDAGSLKP